MTENKNNHSSNKIMENLHEIIYNTTLNFILHSCSEIIHSKASHFTENAIITDFASFQYIQIPQICNLLKNIITADINAPGLLAELKLL